MLLVGLIIGLAWAPFWLGGNRPIAWGVNGLIFPGLALVHEGAVLLGRRNHAIAIRHVAAPAGLLLGVASWIFLQIASPAPAMVAHPIWAVAGESLGRQLPGSISINRTESVLALIRLMTATSAFWISLQLSRHARRAYLLLSSIAVIVAIYAAGALILWMFFNGDIPLLDAPPAQGGIRGTFVNRNHFATYAGLGLVVSVGLALRRFDHTGADWRMRLRASAGAALWIATSAVTLAALLGSVSRGGVIATAIGIVVLFFFAMRQIGGRLSAATIFVAAALALGFAVFSDALLTRVSAVGVDGAARLNTYRIVIGSILDNPLRGLGYGAFIDAFPLYRDQSISTDGLWDKAHNTYLEALQGLGLVFGLALIGALLLLVVKCFKGARNRHRHATPAAVAAAASTLVGVHALVDFSVQIEGVALTFMVILGAGVAQSESSRLALGD